MSGGLLSSQAQQRVFLTFDGLEVDETDHHSYNIERRRVFFDDVMAVTYHRWLGLAYVLVTSIGFLRNAVKWSEAGRGSGSDLDFLAALLRRVDRMVEPVSEDDLPGASIIACDEFGWCLR